MADFPASVNSPWYVSDDTFTNQTFGPSGDSFMPASSRGLRRSRSVLMPSSSVKYLTSSTVRRLRPRLIPATLLSLNAVPR